MLTAGLGDSSLAICDRRIITLVPRSRQRSILAVKFGKSDNHEGHEGHEGSRRLQSQGFSSRTFVSFVVIGLEATYFARCAACSPTLFEDSAIAVPAPNMATANSIRFISRNQN